MFEEMFLHFLTFSLHEIDTDALTKPKYAVLFLIKIWPKKTKQNKQNETKKNQKKNQPNKKH